MTIEERRREAQRSFLDDLQTIYDELTRKDAELGGYYAFSKGEPHPEAETLVERFLTELELPRTNETVHAALSRIVGLREDGLDQVMKGLGLDEEEIVRRKEKAYFFVADFHLERFEALLSWIDEKGLLTPFYRTVLRGIHSVGIAMTRWQNGWTSHIIHGINRDLYRLFNGDEEKIFEMLREKGLIDRRGGEEADRCYSVLVPEGEGYRRVSYAEAFAREVAEVEAALDAWIESLAELDDPVWDQKEAWLTYLAALRRAFLHTDPDELVEYWAEVDRAWMGITTPLQPGHPLEYYEDHYRKAVALEWDLRIVNPSLQRSIRVGGDVRRFAAKLAVDLGLEAQRIFAKNVDQIERTQLYVGRPMLFYAAEFNGLFSAQVVPNDETVSAQMGKKIFAYADFVRESQLSRPVMELAVEAFGVEFLRRRRALMQDAPRWMRIYEIETIGHEYGHILWIDSDTEVAMNRTGQFKNIEEFKATTGGLMAFFDGGEEELNLPLGEDLVSRAVGLMAWREVGEVLPYYCEGLIHLSLLHASGFVRFEGIRVQIDPERFSHMRELYRETYRSLAEHYVAKADAGEFLARYARREGESWLPVDAAVRDFVERYYERYRRIGQRVWNGTL
ncbi:invasion protein CiaB [Nitratifractor sp.]